MTLEDRLEQCYTGAVYDVLRRDFGYQHQTLPPTIHPLEPSRRLAGRIYTVGGEASADLDPHETLLQWTALLSKAPAGCVVVCQPNDETLAHMGELSAETLQLRGVRGYVVDGGCRDSAFILQIGFPVFCRYFTPADVVGRWVARTFGEPITIGDVTIHSDDYMVADRDGAVVIPGEIVADVAARAEEIMQTENMVRTAIREGMDPQQAYLRYGAF